MAATAPPRANQSSEPVERSNLCSTSANHERLFVVKGKIERVFAKHRCILYAEHTFDLREA